MIDFHAHILPGIDDGSKNVDESMTMLDSMSKQGIKRVIATPHFYANYESVDSFIERRKTAFEFLKERSPNSPEILLGAEVKYYDGISHLPELKELRIEGSRLLLFEMPFSKWTEYSVKEIVDIASRGKITPVLAHIERYLPMMKKGILERLSSSGVLFQVNATFFTDFWYRSKAMKMLKNNQIHFIGSDCHNLTDRPPNALKAFSMIEKKMGKAFITDYVDYGNALFLQNQIS